MRSPYLRIKTQDEALDAVERWLDGAILFREFGGFLNQNGHNSGRIDGLALPCSRDFSCMVNRGPLPYWDRCGLIGFEVKLNRQDFVRGAKENQFARYQEGLSGLYVVTPHGVLDRADVPPGCGWLVVGRRHEYGPVAVCRKHPQWAQKQVDLEFLWRMVFRMREKHLQELHEARFNKRLAYSEIGHLLRDKVLPLVQDAAQSAVDFVCQDSVQTG